VIFIYFIFLSIYLFHFYQLGDMRDWRMFSLCRIPDVNILHVKFGQIRMLAGWDLSQNWTTEEQIAEAQL